MKGDILAVKTNNMTRHMTTTRLVQISTLRSAAAFLNIQMMILTAYSLFEASFV